MKTHIIHSCERKRNEYNAEGYGPLSSDDWKPLSIQVLNWCLF